ncbi:lytic transglycosylase domain-containing protein [Thiothrix sp.]|jgi:soluble lytic murein transglycosylase-like protein|uniref:lytic transglycosylase domain-containing protein n=1 Tax=Thiothrix sp. TaxID=1032 RepID=UPI00257A5FD6|nr:lytic transglycosylase domain-containing protein [Thiothrix sp.]
MKTLVRISLFVTITAGWFTPGLALGRVVSNETYTGNPPCWDEAAARYGVPVPLLKAVAHVESSNRARVVARNTNGSLDIGYMQINDWWLPKLAAYGIDKATLLNDACTNLNVGAWILKQGIDRYGYNAQGIGAYGAGTDPKKDHVRTTYANKVFRALGKTADHVPAMDGSMAVASVAVGGMQPTQNAVRQSRRQQRAITTNSPPDDGEQLVWSVFD